MRIHVIKQEALANMLLLALPLSFHTVAHGMGTRIGVVQMSQDSLYGPQYRNNVIFLCNHNSCRSQMADAWLRTLRGDKSIGVASAGIVGGTGVKPNVPEVMAEAGIDGVGDYSSDALEDFDPSTFDVVISCCGCGSRLNCDELVAWTERPTFEDWCLDDPPAIDPGVVIPPRGQAQRLGHAHHS